MGKNILLKIAYDGSGFHGWQRQPDRPTVQGTLEKLLSKLMKSDVTVKGGEERADGGLFSN